jgi:hypothetical protein
MADRPSQADEFREAAREARPSLLREFWEFLKHNKKWWLLPIIIIILLFGLLVVLGGAISPWMYPLL